MTVQKGRHRCKVKNIHPEMDGVVDANGLAQSEQLAAVKEYTP